MDEIRKLFISEHFVKVGFVYGTRYISKKNGEIVSYEEVKKFIENGET